jgi:hypothetical protein
MLYEVCGYSSIKDYEIGYQAECLCGLTYKKYALQTVKENLENFLIVGLLDEEFHLKVYTRNKLLTKYLEDDGFFDMKKEELPLLLGIDPTLDSYIAEEFKDTN